MIKVFKKTIKLLYELESLDMLYRDFSPILYFGNLKKSEVGTLGINPSNIEFEDYNNNILTNSERRFHSLDSLNLNSWEDFSDIEYKKIELTFDNYFSNNPYNIWFKKLDKVFSKTNYSFYFPYTNIIHLDLITFATRIKWGKLDTKIKNLLLNKSQEIFKEILVSTNIKYLYLNGQSVIDAFEIIFGRLNYTYEPELDTVNKKRIAIKKLKKAGLDEIFIKMFIKLLEYIEEI